MENQKTVIKVGTSTLTYENGKVNYRRVESLCKVLADLQNSGENIMLVSSGAIGVGMGKTGLTKRPSETKKKQSTSKGRESEQECLILICRSQEKVITA